MPWHAWNEFNLQRVATTVLAKAIKIVAPLALYVTPSLKGGRFRPLSRSPQYKIGQNNLIQSPIGSSSKLQRLVQPVKGKFYGEPHYTNKLNRSSAWAASFRAGTVWNICMVSYCMCFFLAGWMQSMSEAYSQTMCRTWTQIATTGAVTSLRRYSLWVFGKKRYG